MRRGLCQVDKPLPFAAGQSQHLYETISRDLLKELLTVGVVRGYERPRVGRVAKSTARPPSTSYIPDGSGTAWLAV